MELWNDHEGRPGFNQVSERVGLHDNATARLARPARPARQINIIIIAVTSTNHESRSTAHLVRRVRVQFIAISGAPKIHYRVPDRVVALRQGSFVQFTLRRRVIPVDTPESSRTSLHRCNGCALIVAESSEVVLGL